jgi:cell division protein FtsB
MGELHTLPHGEALLLAEPIPTSFGPVPVEVLSLTIRRLRRAGIRLTTAKLLAADSRAAYSSLLGTMAGLEWANRKMKARVLELEARLAAMEAQP